jgi:hypothetical protein
MNETFLEPENIKTTVSANYSFISTKAPKIYDYRYEVKREKTYQSLSEDPSNRISELRKLHASMLDIDEDSGASRIYNNSLTYYQNPDYSTKLHRPKTDSHNRSSLSPVPNSRASQLDEVIRVKRKLIKRGLLCSIDTIALGLLQPEDLPFDKLDPLKLPRGGERLFINPLMKLGPKKKGKKKKGKKKKTKKM